MQLMQLRKESLKKIRLAGIRTLTSAILVQRSNQLPFSRLPFLFCITMYLNVDVRQFRAILQFLPEIASHSRSNTL